MAEFVAPLVALRQSRKLKLSQLARALDCSVGHLWRVERGHSPASEGFLKRISGYYEMPNTDIVRLYRIARVRYLDSERRQAS